MSLLSVLKTIHKALDFAKGNKTKAGAALVVVGKIVSLFDRDAGEVVERIGEGVSTFGLGVAITRPLAAKP